MTNTDALQSLSSLAVTIQQKGLGLPMNPTQKRVIIKHSAKDGSVSILLPETEDDDIKARTVEVKQVAFVPLMIPHHLVYSDKDNSKRIDTSLSFGQVFDLYQYNDEKTSFGIKTPADAYEEKGVKNTFRALGFIYSLDGKKPSSKKKIKDMFGDEIIPCALDMRWKKFSKLLEAGKQAGVRNDGRPIVEGNIVILSANNNDDMLYEDGDYYYPSFAVQTLTDEQNQSMLDYSLSYRQVLSEYRDKIFANDAFLSILYNQGLTKPRTVSILREMNITDVDSLVETIESYGQTDSERFSKLRELIDSRLGLASPVNSGNVKVEVAQQPSLTPEMMAMIAQMQKMQQGQQLQQAQQLATGASPQVSGIMNQAGMQQAVGGFTGQDTTINQDTGLPF